MGNGNGSAVGFRSLQSIHDLRHVAAFANRTVRQRIAAGVSPSALSTLRSPVVVDQLFDVDGCRLGSGETPALHKALLLTATLPGEDFEAFLTATAILLADRLQNGAGDDDLYWHWDAFQESYADAPDTVRAAIAQGYLASEADGRVVLGEHRYDMNPVTRRPEVLLPALYTLAAVASDEDLYALASADPRTEQLTVFTALKQVIDLQDGILTSDQFEIPGRALRHASDQTGFAGLVPATALLLMNAFQDHDLVPVLERTWTLHHSAIQSLPKRMARPLLAGFRHLYETHADWSPFAGQLYPIAHSSDILLPVIPIES